MYNMRLNATGTGNTKTNVLLQGNPLYELNSMMTDIQISIKFIVT